MDDLIERLRSVKWDVIAEGDRMPDDPTRECVFVDTRPDEFEALLRETAAALEAAREDARVLRRGNERLAEALRELVEVFSESGMYDEEVFAKARAALEQENKQ